MTATSTGPNLPLHNETVAELYEWLFAPSVKELGLRDLDIAPGKVISNSPTSTVLTRAVAGLQQQS